MITIQHAVLAGLFSLACFGSTTAAVAGEPIVRLLVPGFTVEELPVKLPNINNLRFAPDGRLTALGYNGQVYLLRDSNGDGLEDAAESFWNQSALRVPVGMAWSESGLYVSSQGKVSLLRDLDRDGRAEAEEIIAAGWPATDVASGGVDATGVTLGPDGQVYFGLITADYSNPYRLFEGKSRYDLKSPRGTIQKWNPRTRELLTVATGIRVPYALAFNRQGDLFCTDQEGETWLPGGNPLDELNHILPGRHYGFPPRHDSYLPDVEDEPPVAGFGPQHQSACGLVFNESQAPSPNSPGQKRFGPEWWEGDALIAGESRGKIWRVTLAKTLHGYSAHVVTFARLSMLATDLAISPQGHLYVACHSGAPDWGTGPQGEGKLFRIVYSDPQAPQPRAIWPAHPLEVRVLFDRPIDSAMTNFTNSINIEFGQHVRAGDRWEVLKPPYEVVKQQQKQPRGRLRVVSVRLSHDQKTLILGTDPHPQAVHYALTLPSPAAAGLSASGATLELDYDLHGAAAIWRQTNNPASAGLESWMPHWDSRTVAAFSPDLLTSAVPLAGFQTRLVLPHENIALQLQGNLPFTLAHKEQKWAAERISATHYLLSISPKQLGQSANLNLEFHEAASIAGQPDFSASYSIARKSDRDSATPSLLRPLPREWFYLPWAPPPPLPSQARFEQAELAGGDWQTGKHLFFGQQLQCGSCHVIRGEGRAIGPDLSHLVALDTGSLLRDIQQPNASINPDHVAYHLTLRDGELLSGLAKAHDAAHLRLITASGTENILPLKDIREIRPSSVSLMPEGLLEGLSDAQVRHLLTFLKHEPPRREASAELPELAPLPEKARAALRLILVASPQDHGPGEHDYPAWQKNWQQFLDQAGFIQTETAWLWPSPEQLEQASLLLFYYWNHEWNAQQLQQLDRFMERGGGVVLFHSATIADRHPEQLAERIGLAAQPGRTGYLHAPFDLKIVAPDSHPITKGLPRQLHFLDEPYWPMIGDTNKIEVLATATMEAKEHPMMWTFQKGRGRVFASILGHYQWTLDDPYFRLLALRGIAWAAGENTRLLEKLVHTIEKVP